MIQINRYSSIPSGVSLIIILVVAGGELGSLLFLIIGK